MRPSLVLSVVVTSLVAFLGFAAVASGALRPENLPRPVVEDKVADRFTPADYDREAIEGLLGRRMKVNLEARLLKLDTRPLLEGFEKRPGRQAWIGEHAGKFLHAAGNTWAYSGNDALKNRIDSVAADLIATQQEDGYLGTYLKARRWTSWDVWCHKYDLIGLLTYYRMTGDKKALTACRKIGDLLCRTFGTGPGQRNLMTSGTHVGMAPGSVLEPMCMLYRYTGEQRYLDFCYYITKAYEGPDGPKIISSLTAHGNVYKTANRKAYEMFSCLVGLIDLYRLTGDKTFLIPAVNAWEDVVAHRLHVSGTSGRGEYFLDDDDLPGTGHIGEMCFNTTWIQLNWHLLRLTGDAKYADQLERTIHNALFGGIHPTEGTICYFTPLLGKKRYHVRYHGVPGVSCCISSGQRGISLIPQLVWGTLDGAPVIWQYAAGNVTVPLGGGRGKATIASATEFPEDGAVTLTVTPDAETEFPLYLRVPAWCADYTASIDGRRVSGTAGELVKIERTWKPGDKVEIAVDPALQIVPGGKSYPRCVAIQRGPQVLALDAKVDASNPGSLDLAALKSGDLKLVGATEQLPKDWKTTPAYRLEGTARSIVLVPFADAGHTGGKYHVWLGKIPRKRKKAK